LQRSPSRTVARLKNAREATGEIRHDVNKPDPTLRERLVCGLTVLWGLQLIGSNGWKGGWFYNPDDGKETYRAAAELPSKDTLIARIYVGVPLLGRTKTLVRMPRQSADSRCRVTCGLHYRRNALCDRADRPLNGLRKIRYTIRFPKNDGARPERLNARKITADEDI